MVIAIPDWEEEIEELKVFVRDVVLSETGNYVLLDLTWKDFQNVRETINAYCDIDGEVKQQKLKGKDGSWASCQNNYECDSNVCSGGECVEINDAIKEAGALKSLVYRILCKLGNLFNEAKYDICIGEFLGFSPDYSEF